jgi:hypothetical protein
MGPLFQPIHEAETSLKYCIHMRSSNKIIRHFPHRTNHNGTIDSICPRCYATVGTSTWESDLEHLEAAHVCEPAGSKDFARKCIDELAA